MKSLESLDLHGFGTFTEAAAGFRVKRYHLDEPWPYIYSTPRVLLRVDQRGPDYVQFDPPGGSILFRRERFQTRPSFLVWVKCSEHRAFTNFFGPTVGITPASEPEDFFCDYEPERALYRVQQDGIACDTELFVPPDAPCVSAVCTITNASGRERELDVMPAVRPHFAAGSLAPWDVPALYQKLVYCKDKHHVFTIELRSPAGLPEMREYALAVTDFPSPDWIEVDYESFVGRGTFENPERLFGRLSEPSGRCESGVDCTVNGKQGVIALGRRLRLAAGEALTFTIAMGAVDGPPTGHSIEAFAQYLDVRNREDAKNRVRQSIDGLLKKRHVETPDECFSRYVNEWLPLQLRWVSLLDRGWPTGMRGVRDNAQDATALVQLEPGLCRETILKLFSIQRTDGWFPRQYSVKSRRGPHDLRSYVDGGVWVWELFYDYLCWTRDASITTEAVPWLDSDDSSILMDHVRALADYYIAPENTGEHGLCLIREGDWNDSVNRAGLEGRGESVMVSCQAVMMLRQLAALLPRVAASSDSLNRETARYSAAAGRLKECILAHALNREGYLNGIFNDDGRWIFSPDDPDGKRRVSIPVNAFGIIAGVLEGEKALKALEIMKAMKQTDGWPLFWPPIGDPPIDKLGRIGQGDLAPGLGENGTPYNHGCHGFFGRAAAAMGDGDLLLEILRYMLPYDQDAHPTSRAKTAPYGVVNHWKTAPGIEGRGGDCFLSGSISTALRNVYSGLLGIKATLDGLVIAPALPSAWQKVSVEFDYWPARVHLMLQQTQHSPGLFVDGDPVTCVHRDPVLNKDLPCIPDSWFLNKTSVECVCYVV